jgi:hypothetical protein
MARHIGILLLATFAVIGVGFTANAEVDETDRILEATGPQLVALNLCYTNNVIFGSWCTPVSDIIVSVFKACSPDEDRLRIALQKAAPSLAKPALERVLSELRERARAKMDKQLWKNRESFPRACPL